VRGVPTHYIESATRVGGPSLTGQVLRRVPRVHLYSQYEDQARGRWHYAGSVFDGFTPTIRSERAVIRRAVVTLGSMHVFSFRRLLDVVAPLLRPGGVIEREQGVAVETVWQTGETPTDGLGIDARKWLPADEMTDALASADVVVSHGGTGSALSALRVGRFPVLVPRIAADGEIGDEHQDRFARELERRSLVLRRTVDDLTPDDLFLAATRGVERATTAPPFALVP
jgi:UDP-N-acetylglucosamine transferase subunit ALG13